MRVRASALTHPEQTSRGGATWYKDRAMAGIEDKAVHRVPVRAGDPAADVAGWAAKGLAQAGNASAPSAGSGHLTNKVSRATSSCAPSVMHL